MATKRAATKSSANAVSTSGASLDFAFFRFLWRFYQDNRGAIRQNYKELTRKFLDFNNPEKNPKAFLRQPQFEALETYVFLKEFFGNAKVEEIFKAWYERSGKFEGRKFGSFLGTAGQEMFEFGESDELELNSYKVLFDKMRKNSRVYANICQDGSMRRLYPVPFRMIEQDQQFKKWQWIEVGVEKAPADHRPESHKVDIGSLKTEEEVTTKKEWAGRREWIGKMPTFSSFDDIEHTRKDDGLSIALLRPKKVLGLEIKDARSKDWTDEEKEKLMRAQMQGDLFSEAQAKQQVRELRKVPFDFYYSYVYDTPDGEKERKHKIVDWEAGALFWKMYQQHGSSGWKDKFRAKLEDDLISKDLMFLMGNQHRFQDQWLIISLVYPPKRKPVEVRQGSLF